MEKTAYRLFEARCGGFSVKPWRNGGSNTYLEVVLFDRPAIDQIC